MHSKQYLLLVASLLFFACSPSPQTTNLAFNEAVGSTILSAKKITSRDAIRTITKSKPLTAINATELAEIIKSAAGRMHLFAFWTQDCTACIEQLRYLENFTSNKGENTPQLVFINLDTNMKLADINQAISTKSFWLENVESEVWKNLLPIPIIENQPYLLMIRNDENIRVGYNQIFSSSELFNLLHPYPMADGFIN